MARVGEGRGGSIFCGVRERVWVGGRVSKLFKTVKRLLTSWFRFLFLSFFGLLLNVDAPDMTSQWPAVCVVGRRASISADGRRLGVESVGLGAKNYGARAI